MAMLTYQHGRILVPKCSIAEAGAIISGNNQPSLNQAIELRVLNGSDKEVWKEELMTRNYVMYSQSRRPTHIGELKMAQPIIYEGVDEREFWLSGQVGRAFREFYEPNLPRERLTVPIDKYARMLSFYFDVPGDLAKEYASKLQKIGIGHGDIYILREEGVSKENIPFLRRIRLRKFNPSGSNSGSISCDAFHSFELRMPHS